MNTSEKNTKVIGHAVKKVLEGSIAAEMEIEPGDLLLEINGEKIKDIFDYQFMVQDEYLEVLIRKTDGEEWLLEIDKDEDADLGLEFENGLMDDYRSCHNKCIFCFIDQMPKGMRDTLYFKDDDSRLSFLQGNYVTLTNMSDEDVERIIRYRLDPINISFQTMNPKLRCKMLNNRFAGEALKKADRFYSAGIRMNGQIVLCRDVNDKEELDFSIAELVKYIPCLESVSVVPVGLSKFREGLYPLEPFDRKTAEDTIDLIEKWQKKLFSEYNTHFIHASDEWYLLAERPLPEASRYDGFLQLENGVGMLRLLIDEFDEALKKCEGDCKKRDVSIATGYLAAPVINELLNKLKEKYPFITFRVYPIKNYFFGEGITVSGLLTGQDIKNQLAGRHLGDRLCLPENVLRAGEDVFLDDMTVGELSATLQVPIHIVKSDGISLIENVAYL